ncbi:MAG TPA: pyrroloquinoline quinone-dependent dehydrogenase [Candidatus Acidoferrum sp.]|jgi:quinoprotein glucose dehydrogenase|nr:pyrroloquinoline quinone-dependent dehydrogenase [Candidatus Acidoferrum sp.]
MKTSRFWLATVLLRLGWVWTLVIAWPQQVPAQTTSAGSSDSGWSSYGHDAGGTRYSPAGQINRENVAQLEVAWTYRTGALDQIEDDLKEHAAFEATPILVDGRLYLSTPFDHVIALEPETGKKIWEYDPRLDASHGFSEVTSRGVSAWKDSAAKPGQLCGLRIFIGTLDARLIALDGETGKPCVDFGANGQIDLTKDVNLRDAGQYQVTSAPAIAGNLVITGSSIGDNRAVELERGIVRAFDARSGKQRWSWDPIPWASKSSPRTGAGNAWSTLSVDAERDLVFIPTGSASPDYFGGLRSGDNKWANSVVALHASTGEFVWGFQVVHHDLWDYDVASQPTLFSWREGTPAVAITTKMGRVFVLNRLTGAPLLPVEERPAPKSDIPGEHASPTQPASAISMVPEKLSPEDAWGKTPEEKQACADKIRAARSEGIFTPPSVKGSIVFPGSVGGVNWGGAAYDPQRHLLVMDTNRLAIFVRLIPREKYDADVKVATSNDRLHGEWGRQAGAPYAVFRTPLIGPSETLALCSPPPWGTVAAVDLFTGQKAWDVPLGTFVPGKNTGTVTLGGPIATAGGVVFSAATMDNHIRAFDTESGKEIWKYELPAGGQATPMTYTLNGKQYLVIAAGGHGKLGTKQGDYVLAFTLP